jgi:hypothetical protein
MKIKENTFQYGLLILIQWIVVFQSVAQIEIKAVIFDDENNVPVIGASIVEINTGNGVVSDYSGRFTITVNDTSKIRVSYLGYTDFILHPQEFKDDTLYLSIDSTKLIDVHYYSAKMFYLGYFGDMKRLPFGFSTFYFHPYLFGQTILLSGQVSYKTDFDSNYDLICVLGRTKIVEFRNYLLSVSASFQKRELNTLEIIDYKIVFNNYLFNTFATSIGFGIKEDLNNEYTLNKGLLFGLSKNFGKTLTYVSGDIAMYNGYSEYGFQILQRLSKYKRFWRNLRFGLDYQNYKDYDEFNLILRYAISF